MDKENGKKQGGMEEERKENLSCQVQESFANIICIFIVQHSWTIDFQNNIFIFNILGRQVYTSAGPRSVLVSAGAMSSRPWSGPSLA